MGYDMSMIENDTSMDTEHAKARDDFNAACMARNACQLHTPEWEAAQLVVEEAGERMYATDLNYFRLNIFGMSKMRESMHRLGMLATEYDGPRWPNPADFGIEGDDYWDYQERREINGGPQPGEEHLEKFFQAQEEHLSWSPPDEPGLPVHKFGSNDGWVVTPRDIAGALALLDKADPKEVEAVRAEWARDDGTNGFDDWIEFLKRAGKLSGFAVY